jgi:hypothetical protein
MQGNALKVKGTYTALLADSQEIPSALQPRVDTFRGEPAQVALAEHLNGAAQMPAIRSNAFVPKP